jgi:hypothetical protein
MDVLVKNHNLPIIDHRHSTFRAAGQVCFSDQWGTRAVGTPFGVGVRGGLLVAGLPMTETKRTTHFSAKPCFTSKLAFSSHHRPDKHIASICFGTGWNLDR